MEETETDEVIEKAGELGEEYEKTCTGCSQSVVAALQDALDLPSGEVFKAASGLADGIGLSGDGSCGALTGGSMMISLVFGRDREHHQDMMAAMNSYLLCKELYQDFMDRYGSCRCYDIQQKLMGRTFDLLDPKDLEAAGKAGMMETCSKVVAGSAKKAAEIITRERGK
ncbi:MAG: C-GCAxxG-C-C family protein [bacterium]